MRRRKLKKLLHGLNRLKRRPPKRDRLLKRVAVLQKEAGRVKSFVKVREPGVDEPVNRRPSSAPSIAPPGRRRWNGTAATSCVPRSRGTTSRRRWRRRRRYCGNGTCNWSASRRRSRPSRATWACVRSITSAVARRGPHPGRVPGLLPERDAADEIAGVGRGSDATCGAAVDVTDSDAGGSHPHDRWAGAGSSAAHGAGSGAENDPGAPGDGASPAAAAADPAGRVDGSDTIARPSEMNRICSADLWQKTAFLTPPGQVGLNLRRSG